MKSQNSIVLCVILLILLPFQAELRAQTGSIKILVSIEVDSVPADFPVSFSFIEQDDWQFIAYYNKNRNLSVAARKVNDDSWKYKVLPTKVGWDTHNRIAMTLDRDHCIHVSGNMHNDSMTYFKTEQPFDVSTFQQVFPLVSEEDELQSTYPNFLKSPAGQIVYSYRKGGSGNGITISNIYDEQSKSFSRLSDQPLFDGLEQMSAYARGPHLGPDGYYHLSWLWRDTPHCETNHDLSYAKSKDLITWETIGGESLALPITPNNREFTVDPVPAGGGVINGAFKLFFTPDNTPLLAYMKYDLHGNNQYFIAKEVDGLWEIRQVSNWNYRWEFTGPGSIDFQIKLKDAVATDDGNIIISYWHTNRGDGELWVDLKSLQLVEDKSIDISQETTLPQELLQPTRDEAGMTVHWLRPVRQANHLDVVYMLRWETMGKQRYYEPPETPVKPSVLKLYKFSKVK